MLPQHPSVTKFVVLTFAGNLCCRLQELYGDEVAGAMLNALSRLLTSYLQAAGFTCGMDDLLLVPSAEAQRARVGAELAS
jgi:DNA-directed RNA polymerase I subunit RPA1